VVLDGLDIGLCFAPGSVRPGHWFGKGQGCRIEEVRGEKFPGLGDMFLALQEISARAVVTILNATEVSLENVQVLDVNPAVLFEPVTQHHAHFSPLVRVSLFLQGSPGAIDSHDPGVAMRAILVTVPELDQSIVDPGAQASDIDEQHINVRRLTGYRVRQDPDTIANELHRALLAVELRPVHFAAVAMDEGGPVLPEPGRVQGDNVWPAHVLLGLPGGQDILRIDQGFLAGRLERLRGREWILLLEPPETFLASGGELIDLEPAPVQVLGSQAILFKHTEQFELFVRELKLVITFQGVFGLPVPGKEDSQVSVLAFLRELPLSVKVVADPVGG